MPALLGAFADLGAAVVDPVGDDRPAVVLAGLGMIQLIAALRAVLHRIERAGVGGAALRPAVRCSPIDHTSGAQPRQFRIVGRDRAVGVDADDLADVVRRVLRFSAQLVALARVVMNSVPSFAQTRREPKWCPLLAAGC